MRHLDTTDPRNTPSADSDLRETFDADAANTFEEVKKSFERPVDSYDHWEVVDHETGETFVVDSYEAMYEACEGTDLCAYGFDGTDR